MFKANSLGWPKEFQLPTDESCMFIGIVDRETFHKGLKELVQIGAISVLQESTGRHVARWVTFENCSLYHPKKSEGYTEGTPEGNHVGKIVYDPVFSEGIPEGMGEGTPDGYPKVTQPILNYKELKEIIETKETNKTNNVADFEKSADQSIADIPQKKREKKTPPGSAAPPSLLTRMKQEVLMRHDDYYWEAKDAENAKKIVNKIRHGWRTKHEGQEATDEQVVESFAMILDNLPEFHSGKFSIPLVNSQYNSIISEIRKKYKPNGNGQLTNGAGNSKTDITESLRIGLDLARNAWS